MFGHPALEAGRRAGEGSAICGPLPRPHSHALGWSMAPAALGLHVCQANWAFSALLLHARARSRRPGSEAEGGAGAFLAGTAFLRSPPLTRASGPQEPRAAAERSPCGSLCSWAPASRGSQPGQSVPRTPVLLSCSLLCRPRPALSLPCALPAGRSPSSGQCGSFSPSTDSVTQPFILCVHNCA